MSGFANPIIGGGGALVYPSIHSPGFTAAPLTGWSIDKDGNASFATITLGSGQVLQVYYQAAAPTGTIATGSLWFDTSAGYQLSRWDGAAWVAVTWNAADVLGAGTITAALLVAGIVVAGIVDATTINAATFTGSVFEGTDFLINTDGAFFYSGTPAAGNLIISATYAAGTDAFGNAYQAELTVYSGASYLQLGSASLTGAVTGSGATSLPGIAPDADGVSWDIASGGKNAAHTDRAQLRMQGGAAPLIITGSGSPLVSSDPVAGYPTAETWHSLAIPSGWADASGNGSGFRYRLLPTGQVALDVDLTSPSTAPADGTTLGTLPAGYRPTATRGGPVSSTKQTASGTQTPKLNIGSGGGIACYGIAASARIIATLIFATD